MASKPDERILLPGDKKWRSPEPTWHTVIGSHGCAASSPYDPSDFSPLHAAWQLIVFFMRDERAEGLVGKESLSLINAAVWDIQDGFGAPGMVQGDWSGIRDSSVSATFKMAAAIAAILGEISPTEV